MKKIFVAAVSTIIAVAFAGLVFAGTQEEKPAPAPVPTPTSEPAPTPAPAPAPAK